MSDIQTKIAIRINDLVIAYNYSPQDKKYPGVNIMSVYLAKSENINIETIPHLNFGSERKNKSIIDKICRGLMTLEDAINFNKID